MPGKARWFWAFRFPERKWKMKVFDRFPAGQTPAEPDSLDGCLPDIKSNTFGNHRVKAVPIIMATEACSSSSVSYKVSLGFATDPASLNVRGVPGGSGGIGRFAAFWAHPAPASAVTVRSNVLN